MSFKADRKVTASHSQLLVEDPEAFVQRLKQRLALKEGVPESQHRLIFSVSNELASVAPSAGRGAEEVVKDLHCWQAIVYQNERAVGRLISPKVSVAELSSKGLTPSDSEERGVAFEIISIEYNQWQPAWLRNKDQLKQLYLPVDQAFQASSFRIQVIGQSNSRPFAVPVTYTFEGSTVACALGGEVQRAEYIRKHQLARGDPVPGSKHLRNISIDCGRGLGGFTTVFDAEDQPAWLKSIALRFAVVARRTLDEAVPDQEQHPMSERGPQIASQTAESNAQDTPYLAEQEARDSWLPKNVGPAPSSGRKTKTKQKSKKITQTKRGEPEKSQDSEATSEAEKISIPAEGVEEIEQESTHTQRQSSRKGGESTSIEANQLDFGRHKDGAAKAGGQSTRDIAASSGQAELPGGIVPVNTVNATSIHATQLPTAQMQPAKKGKSLQSSSSRLSSQDETLQKPTSRSAERSERPTVPRTPQDSLLVGHISGQIKTGRPTSMGNKRTIQPEPLPPALSPPEDAKTAGESPEAGSIKSSRLKPASSQATPKAASVPKRADTTLTSKEDDVEAAGNQISASRQLAGSAQQPAVIRSKPVAISQAEPRASLKNATKDSDRLNLEQAKGLERKSGQASKAHRGALTSKLAVGNMLIPGMSTDDISRHNHQGDDVGRVDSRQDDSSSDGSLQTAFSEFGGSSPSNDARCSEAVNPLAHAGNSGAHSSTGASFHTYGSADSGRSGTGNDEDAAASASELLEILQISDTLNPSAASARMKTLSTPPVSLAPYENARRPSSMAELPKQVWPVSMPHVISPVGLVPNADPPTELRQGNSDSTDPLRLTGIPGSSQRAVRMDVIDPLAEGNHLWAVLNDRMAMNGYVQQPSMLDIPFNLSGNLPSSRPLRTRPHSSADLTEQSSDPVLPQPSRRTVPAAQDEARRLPSPAHHNTSQTATDARGPGGSLQGAAARPNGYRSSAELQAHESPAGDPRQWPRRDGSGPSGQPARPYSASSPRFDGSPSSRTFSHDSLADPNTRALLAELHKVRANMGSGEGGRANRSGFMTPPPPPPPRTPPISALDSSLTIERQGSFQVPQPSQSTVFDSHGQPVCDLERLLSCVTPVLMVNGKPAVGEENLQSARLADVWKFFEEPSSYGREVYTRSGRRGPALAYYTPFLSAIRALLPSKKSSRREEGEVHVCPLLHHFETDPPFNREPLSDAIANMTADPVSGHMDWHEALICDLHPASWFAVAWYPIYRIPDAPLVGKFLTYHSLNPVPASQTFFGIMDGSKSGTVTNGSSASPLCLPILGLKCAEQKGEPWLEMYNKSAAARSEWENRLRQLQSNADNLSAGSQLRMLNRKGGWEKTHRSHNDLEWFNRHP